MKKLFLLLACFPLLFQSCIKDEAPNSEADILSFTLPDNLIYAEPIIGNEDITLFLKKGVDATQVTPSITLSKGATLATNIITFDFSKPTTITVISEDKKYSKLYTIKPASSISDSTSDSISGPFTYYFNFESWVGNSKYPMLSDKLWASGNLGISIFSPTKYPTHSVKLSENNTALELETMEGKEVMGRKMPIFSASCFYGLFKLNLFSPPSGVLLGQPFPQENGKPIKMTGYYKYTPGEIFINKDGPVENAVDSCTVRAFLYRVRKGAKTATENYDGEDYLTGVDDIFKSTQLIAIANMENAGKKENLSLFELDFKYKEELDFKKYDYRLAIVFASSKRGDFYEGAIGSKLTIDDVRIICEPLNTNIK